MSEAQVSEAGPRGWKFVLRALRYRNYRLFFVGQGTSLIGTHMQWVALPWLVWTLFHSYWLLGVIGFLGPLPAVLLTPFAGVIADRVSRHRLIILTQFCAMVLAVLWTALALSGRFEVWQILALSMAGGAVNAFDITGRQSFVVEMVERREDLPNAIALNSSMFNAARLVGPALAGAVLASGPSLARVPGIAQAVNTQLLGVALCFALNAVSFLAVLLALLAMRVAPREPGPRRKVWHELAEGFRYSFGHPGLRAVLILSLMTGLLGSGWGVLLAPLVDRVYHAGPHAFGLLSSAGGLGAITGAIYLASRRTLRGLGVVLVCGGLLSGLGLIAFSRVSVLALGLPLVVLMNLGAMIQGASGNTTLQTLTDDDKRGRVMSMWTLTAFAGGPFASLIAGALAGAIGAPNTILLCGVGVLVSVLVFASAMLRNRQLRHPGYGEGEERRT